MPNQRGASLLFVLLIVALAVLVATWMALPSITAARNEKIESDLNRGVATSAKADPAKAAAIERSAAAEFAAAHGGFKAMVGTEGYRALSPRCRELVDMHVALLDKPAGNATDNARTRASVADIEHKFGAECADNEAAAPATASMGAPPADPADAAEQGKRQMCMEKRAAAERHRAVVERARVEGTPKAGTIDDRTFVEEHAKQMERLDADIAANCR